VKSSSKAIEKIFFMKQIPFSYIIARFIKTFL